MKKLLVILSAFLPLAVIAQVRPDGSFKTVLKGTVDSNDRLYLYDQFTDLRNINPDFIIPVTGNKFEFTLTGDAVVEYTLCFLDDLENGSFYRNDFFPDQDTVNFILYRSDDDYNKNRVYGSAVNRAKAEYKRQQELFIHIDSLQQIRSEMEADGTYYTVTFNDIVAKYLKLKKENAPAEEIEVLREILGKMESEGTDMTPEAQSLEKTIKETWAKRPEWQLQYIIANPDLYSYSMLYDYLSHRRELLVDKTEIENVDKAYKLLSAANPGHIYNERTGKLLSGLKAGVPGGKYVDFSAPDLDGKMHMLSDDIAGKIAVIDLWASWCGPCRQHSMEMIPVYEKYKDRGLTIVGVAREFKNTNDLRAAVTRDGYPW